MEASPGLHAVLRATAVELEELALLTDDLGGARIVSAEQWQSLDLISQRLAGLGSFLHTLIPELPDCQPQLHGALATVRVGALVGRLLGQRGEMVEESGELDFFES